MAGAIQLLRLGDAMLGEPIVQVDLLTAVPTALDPATWSKVSSPGYSPATAKMELQVDARPAALYFQLDFVFPLPDQISNIAAFGVSYLGNGIAVGEVTDTAGNPLGSFQGDLYLQIPILFQNWIP